MFDLQWLLYAISLVQTRLRQAANRGPQKRPVTFRINRCIDVLFVRLWCYDFHLSRDALDVSGHAAIIGRDNLKKAHCQGRSQGITMRGHIDSSLTTSGKIWFSQLNVAPVWSPSVFSMVALSACRVVGWAENWACASLLRAAAHDSFVCRRLFLCCQSLCPNHSWNVDSAVYKVFVIYCASIHFASIKFWSSTNDDL